MGRITYDSVLTVDFEDRVLTHLQIVVGAKFRRGESFWFSWRDDISVGDGRSTVWMTPAVSVAFKFFGSRPPAINRTWVDDLMLTANSPAGLHVVAEPENTDATRTPSDS